MEENISFSIREFELVEELPEGEALASEALAAINSNPFVTWVKFILTDDLPNANKQRIPVEEFANIIKSGCYMPLKMAYEKINDGHEQSFPVGCISHLKQYKNQVIGLAALWDKERPQDISLIKERYANKMPLQLSWEILFKDSVMNAENGVTDLKDTSLRAVTLVGRPAYEGRTPIVAVAAVEGEEGDSSVWTSAYINDLPDSSFLYIEDGGTKDSDGKTTPRSLRHLPVKDSSGKVDPEHVRNAISRAPQIVLKDGKKISASLATSLQNKARKMMSANSNLEDNKLDELEKLQKEVERLTALLTEKETALAEKITALEAKETELTTASTELEELKKFKNDFESAKAEVEKLAKIKEKFISAGIQKDDEYFASNKEMLMSYTPEALDFMLQEMIAFSATKESKSSKKEDETAPNLIANPNGVPTTKEIAEYLRKTAIK